MGMRQFNHFLLLIVRRNLTSLSSPLKEQSKQWELLLTGGSFFPHTCQLAKPRPVTSINLIFSWRLYNFGKILSQGSVFVLRVSCCWFWLRHKDPLLRVHFERILRRHLQLTIMTSALQGNSEPFSHKSRIKRIP